MDKRPKKIVDRGNDPIMVVEGFEEIYVRDISKHKQILQQTQMEILSFREAVSHEVKRKKYYLSLIGGGKFNDESLKKSIDMINVNIKHLSDKVKISQDKIDHNTLIVETLSDQLVEYRTNLVKLSEYRKKELDATRDRLGKHAG